MAGERKLRVKLIVGSTRERRFSERPARWMMDQLQKRDDIEAEMLDLRDYPMPYYDAPVTSIMLNGDYPHESVRLWAAKIAAADGFIVVTPEYNHGYPAVLKNSFDWLFKEWNHKPLGFVAYGSASGARSVEQLRQVSIELQMFPLRNAVHIAPEIKGAVTAAPEPVSEELFRPLREPVDRVQLLLDELVEVGRAANSLRERS